MGGGERSEATAGAATSGSDEATLLAALRKGDEGAFLALVERYHGPLQRVALSYVGSWALAEEVVQETWLGVLQGLKGFEGRASLKTWIFRILTNRARSKGAREARSITFADLAGSRAADDEPAVDADLFVPDGQPDAGWWASHPASWSALPEERLLAAETRGMIEQAVAALPSNQRIVISLRDIEGWPADEVCQLLQLSEVNQRVLLHRARARVRRALEQHLAES